MDIRICYVLVARGRDAEPHDVVAAPCGIGCVTRAINIARDRNKFDEAGLYYFASQHLPQDFPTEDSNNGLDKRHHLCHR